MKTKQHQGFTLYQISNHPAIAEMERYVSWAGLDIGLDPEYGYGIKLKYRIWAFIGETEMPISSGAMYVALFATNDNCVDENGQYVECGTPDSTGEYDFYMGKKNQPIVFETIITAKIQWADDNGKFNTF